ncbi:alpha-1,6-mannosylglycoprotein 6-beta-N-acetylglucosaminyltransferase A-like [Cottoperca gobio]|uniref:alpha-1,6-mannosyl-glycoprotein 6-beta-N-acetylglucosaminyltransferase n=1 Tax=Cottoperca gobio TaxID=56716 RepID=A0A6J2RXX6_COTGO|nr:alpha-1,6-mannosylglycoprotein 6-beta-N-acetylglucosaminyltransferase A-like [Cottoperca gobio]
MEAANREREAKLEVEAQQNQALETLEEHVQVARKDRSNAEQEFMSRAAHNSDVSMETDKSDIPAPPGLSYFKELLHTIQIKLDSEKEKGQLKDEMISKLHSDKLQLQQQVAHIEELLKQQAEKEEKKVKSDDQIKEETHCTLPFMDGYPDCKGKLKWLKEMWRTDPCYVSYGVNGSLCSFLIYLSEIESWCPLLPGRVIPAVSGENSEAGSELAVVRDSLTGLYPSLENKVQFRWIHQRVRSMEGIWVEAGRSLSAKYNLRERKVKQILVHPGVVTYESRARITEAAFSGGPLGELVQWSDLISTLYILGHNLHLTTSIPDLKYFFGATGGCPPNYLKTTVNLIYTDIIGLRQIKNMLQASWINYRCLIRVLDTFGTEPDFNHAAWAKKHNLESPFGSLNMIPLQFYTMFPHTPDNTFLGFVVQHQRSSEEAEQLESTRRLNQALVYGKRQTFWKGKTAYLDVIHKHLEIHGTVDSIALIPKYVINHGIIKGTKVQALLRQSKVFVGLSFPYEGPAPLEAIANGCAFLNPRLRPPQNRLNTEFFKGKPNIREVTSQHPYAEAIGEPYVWMVDMHNTTDVERALTAILNQSIEPYLPYEFSCEGMLQRVNILIEKQDLCTSTGSWPPLSVLQVVKAEVDTSCKTACQKEGLICEPAFFPHLNNAKHLANYSVDCQTSELSDSRLVFPAYNSSSKHCRFQSDPLLFSCVRSDQSLIRICPCRDYIKDQIALCKECI